MARGTLRYWAAARAAAGLESEPYDAATLADAVADAGRTHGAPLVAVLERSTFLLDGLRVRPDAELPEGGVVEVLPPFAGG